VIVPDDQPSTFYENYRAALSRITEYVDQGGFFWFGAAAWGWNGGDLADTALPGGATVQQSFQESNDVTEPDHPIVQGVPDPFNGAAASHAVFENVPEAADVIAVGGDDPRPTIVEYEIGSGKVLGTGQPLEYSFEFGQDPKRILENTVPYVNAFEGSSDVPWLSVEPASGTVTPGGSATLDVTVDTSKLAAGLYRARLVVRSNDPRTPTASVAVTVVVPAYQVAVDVGGTRPFTDGDGETWVADQRFTAGQWGYYSGTSSRLTTSRAIGGTVDDRLYQTARNNPVEYRFDGVPNGVYEIDLRSAEINGRRPNRRVFDVIAENNFLLPAHDISLEVGTFHADRHVYEVIVTDGQLDVRFVPRGGFAAPIVNGLRVTHRPDR
jgi:hypothetical protein